MIRYKNYIRPSDLSEAYELNKKKSAVIAGGFCFLRLGNKTVQTLIDVDGLLPCEIEEREEEFVIGAMASLRDLEQHEGLNRYTKGAARDCVKHIVGTQFRNLATVGGSIFGRFGFSDVLTLFLAMDTYVCLYKGGQVSLREFINRDRDNDILTAVIIKKTAIKTAYESMRNESVDFPVLTVGVAEYPDGITMVSVGARPAKASYTIYRGTLSMLAEDKEAVKELAGQFTYGTNMRGSKEYRKYLAEVLIGRAAARAMKQEMEDKNA